MKETQRKILIVDDDVEIIHLLRVVFEKKGFCVIDANDSKMALIQLETCSIDLIILDIMLSY